MNILKSVALALLLAGPVSQVHAQAQNFKGLSVGANFLFDGASLNASDGSSNSASSTGVAVNGLYVLPLGSRMTLGFGATVDIGTRKAGDYSSSGVQADTRDRYSLDLVPGFVIGQEYLLYAKLSAVAGKGTADDGTIMSLQGIGYGLGLRGGLSNNYYWQLGYEVIRFRDVDTNSGVTASFKHGMATMGIGYRF